MLAVVDQRISQKNADALQALGYSVLPLPPHPTLSSPVASHPDMLLFFASDAVFCTKSYLEIAKKELETIAAVCARPIRCVDEEYGSRYPHDILLNSAPIGNRLFCLASHCARALINAPSRKLCPVKQGYAKCSVIPVGEDALITDDPSIAKVAEREGLSVLQIEKDAVVLNGYDTGLIGGCASFAPYAQTDEILFCGDLMCHVSHREITDFCNRHGKAVRSLSSEALTDVGTIFLI